MSEPRGYRKPKRKFDIPERVAERAATRYVADEDGCWISTYSVASHGYAQIGWQDRDFRQIVTAHRASWVHFHGQIPEGMTIDHMCRVRRCVNPAHLRMMPNLDNARDNGQSRRGKPTPTGETCTSGHVVLLYPSGARHCRECANAWGRAKKHRRSLRLAGSSG